MAKLTSRNPPSGGRTSVWVGIPRLRVVNGTAMTSPDGLWLNGSAETMRTGR